MFSSFFQRRGRLLLIVPARYMSKYLQKAATKRLPLTTKRAGKGYYKGKGGTKEGRVTSKGKFIVDLSKRIELIVPDLTGFKVGFEWIEPPRSCGGVLICPLLLTVSRLFLSLNRT